MKFWNKLIFYSYAALFFFVPLIFTPWNYELFEFNKMVLVYLLTTVITWAWLMKTLEQKKLSFNLSFWDIPLIIFLISQILATIFSIDPHTSIFGYYSRLHGGLLSTIAYLLLYWGLVNNITKQNKKRLINFGLAGGILVSVYGIAQHFGIDKHFWVQDVQKRIFSTLGQPNWLAAYLNILIFIVLAKFNKNKFSVRPLILVIVFYTTLLFTKSRSGFIGFALPFLLWLGVNGYKNYQTPKKQKLKKLGIVAGTIFGLSLIIGLPFSLNPKTLFKKLNFSFLSDVQVEQTTVKKQEVPEGLNITPSSDIRKIVWQGAIKLWKKYPLLGTGVETFAYSYYWTRPKAHNLTSEWDFLYNKAHNEYLNFAATSGTIGLLAYLFLPISLFIYLYKNKSQPATLLIYPFISILITNFFGFSVVPVAIFFYLLPALFIPDKQKVELINLGQFDILLQPLFTTIGLFLVFKITTFWLADFYFARGVNHYQAGFLEQGISQLNKSINYRPNEPLYYSHRATAKSQKVAWLTQNDQEQEAEKIINPSLDDINKALAISPYHINFYKRKAKVSYYLSFQDLKYLQPGLEALLKAEELAPTDPKLPYNIGLINQTLDQDKKAKQYLQKALELKPNYQAAQNALEEFKI
jgi:O-antigen ligase